MEKDMRGNENSRSYGHHDHIPIEKDPHMRKITRRELLIGATSFSLGVLATVGGMTLHERAKDNQEALPLTPGHGDTEKNLVIEWIPDTVKRWKPKIEKYSSEHDIDPNLLAIMMTVESGGDPNADSGVAKGLMQVTDLTGRDINDRLIANKKSEYNLKDPDTSIEFGAVYIRYLIDEFGDANQGPSWDETVSLVAAGYNGGLTAAKLYRDDKWQGLESYDLQTLNYTRYVRVMWQERHDPLSFTYRYWHDAANGKALVDNAADYQLP
jgi:hypothetical protein